MTTDIEEITVDYWYAAKAVRTGRTVTGRELTEQDVELADASLIEVMREAPTESLRNCARELCLARGIGGQVVPLHSGGAA